MAGPGVEPHDSWIGRPQLLPSELSGQLWICRKNCLRVFCAHQHPYFLCAFRVLSAVPLPIYRKFSGGRQPRAPGAESRRLYFPPGGVFRQRRCEFKRSIYLKNKHSISTTVYFVNLYQLVEPRGYNLTFKRELVEDPMCRIACFPSSDLI